MKTKTWVLVDYNKLEMWDVELPTLEEGQALVEIHYTSICGSQINEISGKKGEDKYLPHLLGHEAVGVVKEINSPTKSYLQERSVICSWINDIREYRPSIPKYKGVNAGPITTFSQYSVIDIGKLIPLWPEYKPEPELALFGCTVPTGAGILYKYRMKSMFSASYPAKILIMGLGGVGRAAALYAQDIPHAEIYGFDTNDNKWYDAIDKGLVKKWHPAEYGEFDFVLECSGNKNAMEMAFERTKKHGGKMLMIGNARPEDRISVNPFDFIEGKEIVGVAGGNCNHANILSLVLDGYKKYSSLISKEYPFEQLDQAAYDLKTGQIIKPIIKCQ